MRPGMECPRSLLASFNPESSLFSSACVNSILILAPGPRMRRGTIGKWWHAELHGQLGAAPHLRASLRMLFNSKIAANQHRLEPQVQTHLRNLTHGLAGKIRHRDAPAFFGPHGHFGS